MTPETKDERDMTTENEALATALETAANWLAECTQCGKEHVYRQLDAHSMRRYNWTWTDPEDEHLYYRRGNYSTVLLLRRNVTLLRTPEPEIETEPETEAE